MPLATIALAALSAFIAFFNYGSSGELAGGDAGIALAFPLEQLRQTLGVYINAPGFGYDGAPALSAAFPVLALASALHAAYIPTPIVARLLIALDFFVAMVGALRLALALVPENAPGRMPSAFLAALVYGVNRYTVLTYFTAQTYLPMLYAALPWLLYGIVEGCERHRGRGIAIVVAAVALAGGAGANPALFGVALCALVVGGLMELANGTPSRRVAAVAGGGGLLGLACSAWWIAPLWTGIGSGLDTVSAANVPYWAHWMSERSSFLNLFKLDGYTGVNVMPFSAWYASPIGSVLGYVPFAVALIALGAYRRCLSAAALMAFAGAAFLAKGVHEPLGGVYQILLDRIPGFAIFRSPYVKWAPLESVLLTALFALGAAGIARWIATSRRRGGAALVSVFAALAVAVVAFPWPAYAGRMLAPKYNGVGFISTLPGAYRDVARILDAQGARARAVIFNVGGSPYPYYSWGYFGQDPLEVAVRRPPIAFDTILPMAPYMSADTLSAALAFLGIGFVVVHHDVINAVSSPQINVLLAHGDAFALYRSSALGLYRLRKAPAPEVMALDAPLVGVPPPSDAPDDRLSEFAAGRFDPNAGLLVANPGPLAILAPRTKRDEQAALRAGLGWAKDITDAPPSHGNEDAAAFLRGNPLGVAHRTTACGDEQGMSLSSPSSWRLGGADLGRLHARICFARRRVGPILVGGALFPEYHRQTSLPNGDPLQIQIAERSRTAGYAVRVLRPGLPFALTIPRRTQNVELVLPLATLNVPYSASMRTADDRWLFTSDPSIAARLVVHFPHPVPPGSRFLAYLQTSHLDSYVGMQNVKTLPYTLMEPFVEHVTLGIDPSLLTSVRKDARALAEARPLDPAAARALPLAWHASDVTPRSSWTRRLGVVQLHSGAEATEMRARGEIDATSRYRVTFAYRAVGYAELWSSIDGGSGDHIAHLRADGTWHRFSGRLMPPAGSSGEYFLRLRSSRGGVEIRDGRLAADGPSGVVLAWHRGSASTARVLSYARPLPWLFDATVRDCHPCTVRALVSQPSKWSLLGVTVVATFTSAGDTRGPWKGITTGASAWLLDAGPGVARVRIVYVPALMAIAGLVVAIGGVLLTLRVVRRSGATITIERGSAGPLVRWCAVLVAAAALAGSALAADTVENLVWAALVVLSLLCWLSPGDGLVRRGSAGAP